ncbi:MAG: SPFH domain-containing protein [Zoogloeaceae bacterium]|jgi:membrane protease subunit (stomatin/prohibitin family)|nr:SPFH domain-containing protein [Zoogloeaceae bacterium]
MAVIDLVKWNGNPNILAWRFPSQELSTWTQLVVNETQEAYVVKEGVYQGPFGAGRHTLDTENIPLIASLMKLPFGGQSPFTAEVWFVNRVTNLDIRWGTPDPIQLQDPKYQLMVPVRAFGQYGIRITDAKKFLLKLVGTLPGFDAATLADYFKGIFTTRIKTNIAQAIIKNGQSVLEISTHLDTLSGILKTSLAPEMEEYGIGLAQFNIHSINVPENDPAVVSLKAALAKRTEMGILGYNYQQERSFDVLQTAAGNEGAAGGVMGAGMGLGMGVAMGGPMGGALTQMTPIIQTGGISGTPATCPACQAPNPPGTRFCGKCGASLEAANKPPAGVHQCPKCSAAIPADSKFCHSCGCKLTLTCAKCGVDIAVGAKFCGNCGQPLNPA